MKKKLATILATALGVALGVLGMQAARTYLLTPAAPSEAEMDRRIEQRLREVLAAQPLPRHVDEFTTWMDSRVSGRAITYIYHVRGAELAGFEEMVRDTLRRGICATPQMITSLRENVTFTYEYRSADNPGRLMGSFRFTRSDCGV